MGKKGWKGVHPSPPQKHHRTYKKHSVLGGNRKQRRHRRLYWIQDCPDLLPPSSDENDEAAANEYVHIKLTEIHLMDDLHGTTHTIAACVENSNGDDCLPHPPETSNKFTTENLDNKDNINDTKPLSASLPEETGDKLQNSQGGPQHLHNSNKEATSLHTQDNKDIVVDPPKSANTTDIIVDSSLITGQQPKVYIQRLQLMNKSNAKVQPSNYIELPNGNNGDGICNPYNPKLVPNKYWAQRKRLFHLYDSGIQMGETEKDIGEAFFSITPQCIAHHIAQRMIQHHFAHSNPNKYIDKHEPLTIIDAFVGVGGNAIALALQDPNVVVVCIDIDINKLYCTAKNACKVYHIPQHQVILLHHDACTVLSQFYNNGRKQRSTDATTSNSSTTTTWTDNHTVTVDEKRLCGYTLATSFDELPNNIHGIFLSPPWGGVNYEDIGPRHYSIQSNIELTASTLCPATNTVATPPTSTTESSATADDQKNTSAQNIGAMVNGEDLLRYAIQALPIDQLNIAYYLPRNLNGIMFGQSCYNILARDNYCRYDDTPQHQQRKPHGGIRNYIHQIELEQNIVNTKLKTITAYICSSTV